MDDQIWYILHIDDDEDDHVLVRSMLSETQSRSVALDWASSYEEGRKKLKAHLYNAVLIDYDLGAGSGIELIRDFVEDDYPAPFILLTGRGSYAVDVEAMVAGATLYLTKNEINPLLLERSLRYAVERKQAEAELRERDRKLSVALDAAQLSTWIYTFADSTIELDERGQKMYNLDQRRVPIEEVIAALHPDDVNAMRAALQEGADPNGSGRYRSEFRILNSDGTVTWLSVWGLVEYETIGSERRAVRVTGATRDITWEKEAELSLAATNKALRQSEQSVKEIADRFQAVLENSLDVAYRRDIKNNRYDYISPVVEQVLGFTVDEMKHMTFQETLHRIHTDDRAAVEAEILRAADTGKGRLEYRFQCKNGEYRWVADHMTVSQDQQGQMLYRTGIIRDVTEQVQAERALRTSEERFRLASKAVTGILYDWTIGREELYQSEGLERVVGFRPGEEPGGTTDWWPRNIHPDDYPGVQTQLQKAINGETDSFSYEYRIRHKAGHWVNIWDQGYIVRDENRKAQRVVGICTDITERVLASEALRITEDEHRRQKLLLEGVLDALPIGVWITDPSGRMIGKNQAADRVWAGVAPLANSISEYPVYAAWYLESGSKLSAEEYPLAKVLATGKPVEPAEYQIRRFDGTEGILLVSAAPITSRDGQLNGAVAISMDVSDRRMAEAELRRREAAMDAFFEASPGILNLLDQELRYIKSDRQTASYFNLDRHSIVGRSVYELNPAFAETVLHQLFTEVIDKGCSLINLEQAGPIPSRDGEMGYFRSSYFPVPLPDGRAGVGVIGVEVTDTKRAELALSESEERYRLAARATNDAIWDWDIDTDVITWNQALTRLFGYPSSEQKQSSGNWWKEHIHPEDAEQVIQSINDVIYGDAEVWSANYRFRRVDDTYADVQDRGWVLRSENGRPTRMIGAMRDVSEQKQANAELAAYAERLKRSNEDLENFAFIASHDLQEPLRKIIRFGKSLRDQMKGQLPAEAEDYLDRIQRAVERMQAMVNDLLALSRISTHGLPFERVQLTQVAKEVLSDLEVRIQSSGGQVIVDELPAVRGDALQLRRLLQNLVSNALKFHQLNRAPVVRISGEILKNQAETCAVIHVEDNGIGIEEDQLEHIFQPFVRLHSRSRYEGSGIGLAICRKIVERHGGTIRVSSQSGVGTVFSFTLPV